MRTHFRSLGIILILSLVLAACAQTPSFNQAAVNSDQADLEESLMDIEELLTNQSDNPQNQLDPSGDQKINNNWPDGLTRQDNQGAVVVTITPMNLNNPQNTLDFDVSLDTHSVDLNMNLVDLASLKTNIGVMVDAIIWDGPPGGHHVNGTLSFPSTLDDSDLLVDVSAIELTIIDLDVSERVFIWERLEQ